MNIPHARYSLESFLEYVAEHSNEVFEGRKVRKWLKVHLVYTYKDWKRIFETYESVDFGEITRIRFQAPFGESSFYETQFYYVHEWTPGLILMFTSSTEEDYERTLKHFISHTRGITEAWIAPSLFERVKNVLVQKHNAKIYRFISRRRKYWKFPAQIRPQVDRRHSYSGVDAEDTLKELQALYGVIPSSIDIRINDSKLQLNRNGLFVIRHVNRTTIGIIQEIIETVIAEQVRIRETSERFRVHTETIRIKMKDIKIPRVAAGKITLPNVKLSELMVNQMLGQTELYELSESEKIYEEDEIDFSFTDTFVREEPLLFVATVVDEIKGSIFGISGNESEIALIPKHRITFESFVSFYNLVTENFDANAQLTTFSEKIYV